jgi:hypothetical protein
MARQSGQRRRRTASPASPAAPCIALAAIPALLAIPARLATPPPPPGACVAANERSDGGAAAQALWHCLTAPAPPAAGARVAVNERGEGGDCGDQRCDIARQSGQLKLGEVAATARRLASSGEACRRLPIAGRLAFMPAAVQPPAFVGRYTHSSAKDHSAL